ncbi:MAG: DNA-directed RNA polymerase subunit beta', partial [Eubacterium sp.]
RDDDCGCHDGIVVSKIMDGNRVLEPLEERLTGRYCAEPVIDPKTGEVLMETEKMMTAEDAKRIADAGVEAVKIRSLITCKSRHGVCRKCYGANLAFNEPVQVGEAVGIIAAQSIGEPGTQLTMRTFHTGGVAGGADITQGLPRVEELFEARKPKQLAILSEIEGDVRFEEIKKSKHVVVFNKETAEEKKYLIPYGARLCENIVEGAHIQKGTELTLGAVNPHDVLAILGEEAVYNYLIKEVQFAYRTQGVDINDKHIEVIVRQMLKKCTVDDAGDTDLVPGTMVDVAAVDEANDKIDERIKAGEGDLKKATYIPVLMGITKASLATDSFLSAASFQETTRVLTDAAIKGKSDPLIGLKENVIIGKLVPAGTGMDVFREVDVVPSYFSSEGSDEILNLEQLQELLTNTMN